MVATYSIFGRQVGSHVLSIATLSVLFIGGGYSMSGGEKKKTQSPPINAANQDEEKFIKEFLQQANMDEFKEAAAKN